MTWYKVLIGHEGHLSNSRVHREDSPRTEALVAGGFLAPADPGEIIVPERPGTFGLEPEPAKVVAPKRSRRGTSAKAQPGDGEESQSPSGVEPRDVDDVAHGGDGES